MSPSIYKEYSTEHFYPVYRKRTKLAEKCEKPILEALKTPSTIFLSLVFGGGGVGYDFYCIIPGVIPYYPVNIGKIYFCKVVFCFHLNGLS